MTYLGSERPRFIVSELEGYAKPGVGTGAVFGLCVTVVDRAYCCQVIRRWDSETIGYGRLWSRERRRDTIRAEAAALAADLNTKDAARA